MTAPRRHGGYLLPNEVSFPPASGYDCPTPDGYGQPSYQDHYPANTTTEPQYHGHSMTPPNHYVSHAMTPPSQHTGRAVAYTPPSQRHGAYIDPNEAWPEQPVPEKQSPSPESVKSRKKLRKASHSSADQRRHHGGDLTPQDHADGITQVRLTLRPRSSSMT